MKQKAVSILLLITITSLGLGGIFLPAKKAQATVPTNDAKGILVTVAGFLAELIKKAWQVGMDNASRWAVKIQDWLWQEAWAAALAILKKKILDMLANEIIVWIQGGGDPRFITDWWGFLSEATGEAARKFGLELTGIDLCRPFKATLKASFAPEATRSYRQRAECTLEDIVGNIENFYEDFRYGGWDGWLEITKPQNNFYGAYLLAMDEKIDLMAKAKEAAQNKGLAGSGWLGDERCTKCSLFDGDDNKIGSGEGIKSCEDLSGQIPPGGAWQCDKMETFTPGDAVGSLAAEALTSEMEWVKSITSQPELAAYLAAIANALINRIFTEGLAFVDPRGHGRSENTSSQPELPDEDVPAGSIDLAPSGPITLKSGESESILVTVKGTDGKALPGITVTASSNKSGMVMVSPPSMVTNKSGQITFSVTAISVEDEDSEATITFKVADTIVIKTIKVIAKETPPTSTEPPLLLP